jgi:hypothetical protein
MESNLLIESIGMRKKANGMIDFENLLSDNFWRNWIK